MTDFVQEITDEYTEQYGKGKVNPVTGPVVAQKGVEVYEVCSESIRP
jgi:ribosomal protein L11